MELLKLKERIAVKNIEVMAITKDLEEWEVRRAHISKLNVDGSMKRKATLSPNDKMKIEINKNRATGIITMNGFRKINLNLDPHKHLVIKNNDKRKNSHFEEKNALSVLKEESEIEEKDQIDQKIQI
mmetsp:Transcript_32738/g.37399  ORF Transcript_32738/g.37399 Transcript_32738/m.37399 type:complete len:127 (+) Transcript_32738:1197-1577(+)